MLLLDKPSQKAPFTLLFSEKIDPSLYSEAIKGSQELTDTYNPETQTSARQQQWSEHYVWSADRLQIIGKTSIGRATCHRLDLNDDRHNDRFIVRARALWLTGGWHPPDGDPCL